jgi:glucokinase
LAAIAAGSIPGVEARVTAGARQIPVNAEAATGTSFIAADVGGTHARIGLVTRGPGGRLAVEKFIRYVCADYPSLSAILREFIAGLDRRDVQEAAIACAGYCLDGTIINTNLPWTVSLDQMRAELHLSAVEFVNDFEAVAYATPHLEAQDTTTLAAGHETATDAPVLIVGPGTGLGAAVRIPAGSGHVVLATEAGQSAFAPSSDREVDVLRLLRRHSSHVSIEQVLSGPGLVRLHGALCELDGAQATLESPAAITRAALAGDASARQTLDAFCGLLGSVLGNLVLLYGAQGGAYLAGGILPQIKPLLLGSSFLERFLDKGAMRPVLERVPVHLIEHGELGVLGAASWYLERHPRK